MDPTPPPIDPASAPAPPRKPFPGFLQALGLLGLMVVFALAAAVGWLTLSSLFGERRDGLPEIDASIISFVNTVGFGSVCLIGAWAARRPVRDTFRLRGFAPRLLVPLVLLGGAIPVVLEALLVLPFKVGGMEFPEGMFRSFFQPMLELLLANPVATFFTVVVMAPLTEEFFFRGLLLSGFERRYGPARAVVFSTILFCLAHANPVQVPATLLLGLYLGWITLRTRSLFPAILAHALNNLVGFLSLDPAQADRPVSELLQFPAPGILGAAAAGLVVGGFLLVRFLPTRQEV